MLKHIFVAGALTLIAAPAVADGHFPPPPTVVYVAPEVQTCNPVTVQVYFKKGETVLTRSALRSLDAVGQSLDGCALAGVNMVAVAADGRTDSESEALAESRIYSVTRALEDEGLVAPATRAEIEAAQRKAERNKPLERRVEVTLAAYRPEIG